MTRFSTPEHLVSWPKLCPRAVQSGPQSPRRSRPLHPDHRLAAAL
nr:hypothetical protein [Candidatus Mycobacterium methanotrophicum]